MIRTAWCFSLLNLIQLVEGPVIAKYISQGIDEIKQELKQDNIAVKANAVIKLAYLQMLGYDISWAAFNIIEVMSSSKFTFKRIGYLAASQCFYEGTDVIMLTTNQIRKDLSSPNQYDTGVALTGLSCFVTPDLARDLANDIMTLMSHTKPYIRKKAVLIMYKVFLKYPESLRPAFPRLKEKLEDPDAGVQSAAVNVICELARRNPKNYLSLAPLFFKLMTSSTNNWVLIKIIKLFGALTPLEPRLGKKLIEPLTNLIHRLVIAFLISLSSGMPNHSASIQVPMKYLGLLAMSKILKTHPKSVQSHKDLILQCLDDKDESIRLRALDLLYGMVSKKNLMEIVKKLMIHVDKAEGTTYRDELLTKIIDICSQSNYQYITNFEWYISILVELTRLEGTRHGHLIAAQMLDVAIRVKAIRMFAVSQMAMLLDNAHLLAGNMQRNGICEVLYGAAWICGEFSEHLQEPNQTLEAMMMPKVTTLPGHIQAVYVQNAAKLYASVLQQKEQAEDQEGAQEITQMMIDKLPQFVQNADLEVQERASCILQLIKYVQKLQAKGIPVAEEVTALFSGELNPVAPKAQKKVPLPDGLDLDVWINRPPAEISSDDEKPKKTIFHDEEHRHVKPRQPEMDEDELARRREVRKQEQANNPFYIKSSPSPQKVHASGVEHIPVVQIDLSVPLRVPGMPLSDQYLKLEEERQQKIDREKRKKKQKKDKKGKRRHDSHHTESDEDIAPVHHVDIITEEMPEVGSEKAFVSHLLTMGNNGFCPPMSNYYLLAENSFIKMTYDVQGNLQDGSQVIVSIIFENQSSGYLKSMEFNVLDSLNTKLVRPEGSSAHDGVLVPFQLPPEVSNEARFVFAVESIIMPQKLKGTLTFIVKTEDGSSHEKLDFKLHFTCTSYMITTPCYSDAFAKLLESGELKMSSIKVDGLTVSFQLLLAKICFHHHFSVVERIDSCASMYSRSIQGHHMCLLVKMGDCSVSVDGKCSDATLLGNLLDELKQTLTEKC
uniref:AP-3 complex subunit delta-1 n=1 Tax=Callorhinchus milii TaxID=7868 RepID=A0A4W3GT72_CALMI